MNTGLSLCLKITNWCNLSCTHCCESSGPKCPVNLMPLPKFEKYIAQFGDIQLPKTNYFVIGGGEAMAPYIFGNNEYISHVLSSIYESGGIPTIKTNAKWGANVPLRQYILKDLARTAYEYQMVVTLDVSVDEFHDNISETANVISDIVKSSYLAPAIRVCLVGFSTPASKYRLARLQKSLRAIGINTIKTRAGADDFGAIYNNDYGIQIFTSFNNAVYKRGRAIKTQTYTTDEPDGTPDSDGHCLTIDNSDNAVLN